MPSIDLSALTRAMRGAETTPSTPACTVNQYVMEHIFTPLRNDQPVYLKELDYQQFGPDDLDELRSYLEELDNKRYQAAKLSEWFSQAMPCRRADRCFI